MNKFNLGGVQKLVWLFLTTYPSALTFSALFASEHFSTSYSLTSPLLVNVVCERPLMHILKNEMILDGAYFIQNNIKVDIV